MTKILELSKLELPDLEGYTQMLSLPGGNVEEEEFGGFFSLCLHSPFSEE